MTENQQRHSIDISKFELQKSWTRLNDAQAEEIELRNARTKRDLMSLPEVEGLMARLYSRFLAIDMGSRAASERIAQQLSEEMVLIRETIQHWQRKA